MYLFTGYVEPPVGKAMLPGLHYNPYFPGAAIAMGKQLVDGQVEYEDGTPATETQMAKDVAAYIAWASDPRQVERKKTGLGVLIFLFIFAGVTYVSYRRIWKGVAH